MVKKACTFKNKQLLNICLYPVHDLAKEFITWMNFERCKRHTQVHIDTHIQ